MADSDRPSKRRRRDPVPEPPRHPESAVIVPEDVAASLLDRANARILQSAGFSGATRLAQERLRELAEDYYLSMLETIALFAHAQRRTRPTAVDFQQMLTTNFISILSLEDELRRVPSAQPTPLPAPSPQSEEQRQTFEQPDTLRRLLGNELDGGNDQREYIPEYLPPFPSKHTYLETPVFTERPREPRIIREMATEEARLAENALRKILAAAVTGNTRAKTTNGVLHDETTPNGKLTKAQLLKRKNRDDIWEKTFNSIKTKEEAESKLVNGNGGHGDYVSGSGHGSSNNNKGKGRDIQDANVWLEVVVNADNQYWRGGKSKNTYKGVGRAM